MPIVEKMVSIDEETYLKLKDIAEKEGRTIRATVKRLVDEQSKKYKR